MTEYHYYHRYLRLLREIERLEKIHSSDPYRKSMSPWEKDSCYRTERAIIGYKQKLADYLEEDQQPIPCKINGRLVKLDWIVDGIPSKGSKKAAAHWMRKRNINWNGRAPRLCREVRKALEKDQVVPYHHFDLRVLRTVRIEYLSRESETTEAAHET